MQENPCVSLQANRKGLPKAMLVISKAKYADRAYYQCEASKDGDFDAEGVILIRVKGQHNRHILPVSDSNRTQVLQTVDTK